MPPEVTVKNLGGEDRVYFYQERPIRGVMKPGYLYIKNNLLILKHDFDLKKDEKGSVKLYDSLGRCQNTEL